MFSFYRNNAACLNICFFRNLFCRIFDCYGNLLCINNIITYFLLNGNRCIAYSVCRLWFINAYMHSVTAVWLSACLVKYKCIWVWRNFIVKSAVTFVNYVNKFIICIISWNCHSRIIRIIHLRIGHYRKFGIIKRWYFRCVKFCCYMRVTTLQFWRIVIHNVIPLAVQHRVVISHIRIDLLNRIISFFSILISRRTSVLAYIQICSVGLYIVDSHICCGTYRVQCKFKEWRLLICRKFFV